MNSEYKQQFLKSIEENANEVLLDLEKLLPLYSAITKKHSADEMEKFFDICIKPVVLDDEESFYFLAKTEFTNFFTPFNNWINQYSLDKVWIKEIAFYTLEQWQFPEIPRNRFYGDTGEIYMIQAFDSFKFEFDFNYMDFLREGSESLNRKASEAYKSAKDLIKAMEREAKSRGYKQQYKRDFTNLRWLVMWNIKKQTKKTIQSNFNTEKDTIGKAFKMFKTFDLPVRKGKTKV